MRQASGRRRQFITTAKAGELLGRKPAEVEVLIEQGELDSLINEQGRLMVAKVSVSAYKLRAAS